MKYRKDFVTNSSSSSYICEVCGREESGFDLCLEDAEMVECTNGHIICDEDLLDVPRDFMIRELASLYEKDCDEYRSEEELKNMDDDELHSLYFGMNDGRWGVAEEFCPICQFIEYSNHDLAQYLEKEYKVSRDEVFAQVKQLNKRRRKLYDSEYVTEVCKRFNLNPTEIVSGLKGRFGTYKRFAAYIRG